MQRFGTPNDIEVKRQEGLRKVSATTLRLRPPMANGDEKLSRRVNHFVTSPEKMVWVLKLLLARVTTINRTADEVKSDEESESTDDDNENDGYDSSFIDDSNTNKDVDRRSNKDDYRPSPQRTETLENSSISDAEMLDP